MCFSEKSYLVFGYSSTNPFSIFTPHTLQTDIFMLPATVQWPALYNIRFWDDGNNAFYWPYVATMHLKWGSCGWGTEF
jgi:hypothetical protein